MADAPLFTILTPTYNRAHTLPRVYDDLCAQTLQDFEWLIVDDGSADGTHDLVASWMRAATFPVRYLAQPNGGKHVALNRGITLASGEYLLILDSDDRCVPGALETFKREWDSIPPDVRPLYSTVIALCRTPDGALIGESLPSPRVDASTMAEHLRYRDAGERWGASRTSVLREFPLPEIPGERFIAEGVAWNRMARRYRFRFVNDVLQVKDFQPDGLTAASLAIRVRNPRGAQLFYREAMGLDAGWWPALRAAINHVRFSRHAGVSLAAILRESPNPVLSLSAFMPGALMARRDRRTLHTSAC